MFNLKKTITIALFSLIPFSLLHAGEGKPKMGGMDKEHAKMHHHSHMMTMHMLKDMAKILHSLQHKPDAAQKERLAKMVNQIDEMMNVGKSSEHKMKEHNMKEHKMEHNHGHNH